MNEEKKDLEPVLKKEDIGFYYILHGMFWTCGFLAVLVFIILLTERYICH